MPIKLPTLPDKNNIPSCNYNQQEFKILAWLYNLNDDQSVGVAPTSIINLTIDDSLTTWAIGGTLTITYAVDVPEKKYIFRNDGFDTLTLRIYPVNPPTSSKGQGQVDFEKINWEINHFCSIYNIEDIPLPPGAEGMSSSTLKCKKIFFRDFRHFELSTELLQYSTAFSLSALSNKPNATDAERSIPTGKIIEEIITTGITVPELSKITTIKEDWDYGASNLFYTSPADISAYDSLMYAYNRHVSTTTITNNRTDDVNLQNSNSNDPANTTTNDFCLLTVERGPKFGDYGQFVLRPLSNYFKNAGGEPETPKDYQIEHFYIKDFSDQVGIYRAPRNLSTDINNPDRTIPDFNHIQAYEFAEISPNVNSHVYNTRPVYSYNIGARQLNTDFHNNDVLTSKDFVIKQYISKDNILQNDEPEKNFLITLPTNKKSLNLNPTFSLYGQDRTLRKADGLLKLLQAGLFLNACIVFTVPGVTTRIKGRFIGIDRAQGTSLEANDVTFDDKFCGQWFITDVKHIFEGNEYKNVITAIKVHRYQTPYQFNNTL
jgi:hypothetical protein